MQLISVPRVQITGFLLPGCRMLAVELRLMLFSLVPECSPQIPTFSPILGWSPTFLGKTAVWGTGWLRFVATEKSFQSDILLVTKRPKDVTLPLALIPRHNSRAPVNNKTGQYLWKKGTEGFTPYPASWCPSTWELTDSPLWLQFRRGAWGFFSCKKGAIRGDPPSPRLAGVVWPMWADTVCLGRLPSRREEVN